MLKFLVSILILFISAVALAQANPPWVITQQAEEDHENENIVPLWRKIGSINVGYSQSENIDEIETIFNESYKNYIKTEPDIDYENELSSSAKGNYLGNLVTSFEQYCRTFLTVPKKPSGTISYYTGGKIPVSESCKLEVLAFAINGYKLKSSGRERTLILEKSK